MDDHIHERLDRLVPPPSVTPTMPELVERGRAYKRRRDAGIVTASVAAVAAAALMVPSLSLPARDVQPAGERDIQQSAAADDRRLSCPTDGITSRTVYAPRELPAPEDALEDELANRRLSITAEDFDEVRRSEEEVRYEAVVDGRVQGVAVAVRGDEGWSLPVFTTCASLDE